MAKILEEFTFARDTRNRPWDKWLDGQIWQLKKGVDFHGRITSMRGGASSQAKKRGKALRSHVVDDNTLVIQAVPLNGRDEP